MTINTSAPTALERARIAYEQMKRREYNAAMKRRSRARTRNIALAATLATMVMLVVGLSVYNGWMPTPLRTTAQETRPDRTRTAVAPTVQVRSFIKGNTCQELKFDNDSGALVGGSFVPCEKEGKTPPQLTPEGKRLDAIRDALKR